jgi:hypothetical protein
MVGPRSERCTCWTVRLAGAVDGSLPRTVLVPGDLDRPVQCSDARDIATWSVDTHASARDAGDPALTDGAFAALEPQLVALVRG